MRDPSFPPTRISGGVGSDASEGSGASEAAPEIVSSAPRTVREPPRGTAMIGDIIAGRYRVERLVGSGGMAHVLGARHVKLNLPVAIKVLDPDLLSNVEAKERFAREARAMATLSSNHTVRVHDVGALPNGLPYMVMDLLEGQDLARLLIERGPLSFDDACRFIDQACDAVGEAHEKGYVHRDLKPQNLFLSVENIDGREQSIIRVLDFGIARSIGGGTGKLETITKIGDLVGTLTYMAPEQIKSSRDVSPSADIWALGACLYRLLTGKPPFMAKFEAALAERILLHPPTPITELRPDVPPILTSVILRCLRKAPEERFQSAADLRRALDEARIMIAGGGAQSTAPLRKLDERVYRDSQPSTVQSAVRRPRPSDSNLNETLASAGVEASRPANAPAPPPPPPKQDTTVRLHGDRPSKMGATVPLPPLHRQNTPMDSLPAEQQPRLQTSNRNANAITHNVRRAPPSRTLTFVLIALVVALIVTTFGLLVIVLSRPG